MTSLLAEKGFGVGYALMLLGVIVLLDGFAVDTFVHAEDPDLAAEEGVFTFSNPGHLLVAIGLALIIIGACVGPYTRWVLAGRSALLAVLVPAIAVGAALAGSTGFAIAINSMSHEDAAHTHQPVAASDMPVDRGHQAAAQAAETVAGTHGAHDLSNVLMKHKATVSLAESTLHQPENTQGVTEENLRFAEQFLAEAREKTAKYQDVKIAEAEGYFRITPDLPLIGAHWFKPNSEGLEPGDPSILLYQDDGAGGWKLAGLAYTLPKTLGDDRPPETQFGGLAGWHYHSNLCFLSGGGVTIAALAEHCPGAFVQETGWLLHVWAWKDSPEGVFDHANSLLQ